MAVFRGATEAARLLLAAGADPHARDADHRAAKDLLPTRDATNAAAWDEVSAQLRPGDFTQRRLR